MVSLLNLKAEILREHSKAQSEWIAAQVGDSADRFDNLVDLVFGDDETIARRGAWVMSHCVDNHPQLMTGTHLERFVDVLGDQQRHPAIRRNITKILQTTPLPPDDLIARLFDTCCQLVSNPNEPAASRAYSTSILGRICERHPELTDEVKLLIEDAMPNGSAALKARGRMTLEDLEKIGRNS